MRFLLTALNAKYIHSNPALYSLRAYAGGDNVIPDMREHIEIAEFTINNSLQDILAGIYERQPDVIGLSCYIWNWEIISKLIVMLHQVMPTLPIWLGGPEVSFHSEKILEKYPMVTGIMVGEGEETFSELLQYYLGIGSKKPEEIKGLCLPQGFTGERELTDISELPFLYQNLEEFENRILYYESSRGCPFRCSYCLSSIDKTVRLRNLAIVKKELQFFLDHRVKQVKFVDRTFNCNHNHAKEIWKYISDNDNGVTNFHFEIAADLLDEEELELLSGMRPGLVQLEIGVQSTNPETLSAIRRVTDLGKLRKVVERINRAGNVHQHLDLIAGLPHEDYESFAKSFNEVYSMRPEQLQLGFLKVLKGSYMEECVERYGITHMQIPPYEVLSTNWLTYPQILRLKRIEEMVELYYNSNQFTNTIMVMEKYFQTAFAMYEALADFYEEKGYFKMTPSRVYRYEVLLEFIGQCTNMEEDMAKELLTYDLYLRENMKSRPPFGADLSLYKVKYRDIYKERELTRNTTHLEPFFYPVWNAWKEDFSADRMQEPVFVLFNYEKRNPLTHEAATEVLNKE